MPRRLRASWRRNLVRVLLALLIGVFGIGAATSGALLIGLPVILIAAALLAMAIFIAFAPRSYVLELDDDGFRVHDLRGRVAHDVRWSELRRLLPVSANAFAFTVVGWELSPRREGHGFWRWTRGTKHDDGCLPDTYGMKPDAMMDLMLEYAGARAPAATAPADWRLEPF
jgi:hypothetical protein